MTLNGVMAVTLRYFSEVGKPALQKTICGGIYARVCCIFSACTTSLQRKFTFAISSPDEFLVADKFKTMYDNAVNTDTMFRKKVVYLFLNITSQLQARFSYNFQ